VGPQKALIRLIASLLQQYCQFQQPNLSPQNKNLTGLPEYLYSWRNYIAGLSRPSRQPFLVPPRVAGFIRLVRNMPLTHGKFMEGSMDLFLPCVAFCDAILGVDLGMIRFRKKYHPRRLLKNSPEIRYWAPQ